jgi:hypothetical protein
LIFCTTDLAIKDFSTTWCKWIASFMKGVHVGIRINDQVGPNFQTRKGVRQGDPLSLILFNIIVDMLAILINRAKLGQISGVIPHILDEGLSILQYAYDTILFMNHNFDQARNVKLLLTAFKQMFGLKINFHKSDFFCFGNAKHQELQYEQLLGLKKGSYLFRYLGIPMHYRKLNNSDWKMIEERIEKKLNS